MRERKRGFLIAVLALVGVISLPGLAGFAPVARGGDGAKRPQRIFYYRFNENGGWRTFDLTRPRLHAELFHVQWTEDEQRRVVARFDGEKSWASLPASDAFEIEQVAFAAWIKPEAFVEGAALFSTRGEKDGFAIGLNGEGAVFFSPDRDTMHTSDRPVALNEWSLVLVVYNEKKVRFYINGEPAGQKVCAEEIPFHNNSGAIGVLPIHKGHDPATPRYKGCLSTMRMLGQSVSERAAAALYKMSRDVSPPKVLLVPFHGGVGSDYPADVIEEACKKADEEGFDMLVLDVDSPGGRGDHMTRMADALLEIEGVQTVAYVSGRRLINVTNEKEEEQLTNAALSAGALTSLCAQRIIMKSDTQIGAATGINSGTGKKILAKFMAAMRSRCRANAIKAGHSPEVVEAMMEEAQGLSAARLYGNPRFGTEKQLDRLKKEHPDVFEYVEVLAAPSQILGLTGKRSRRVGIAFATASTFEKALKRLGMEDAEVVSFVPQAEKLLAEFEAEQEEVKELQDTLQTLNGLLQEVERSRPDKHPNKYELNQRTGKIGNRRAWRNQCKKCYKAAKDAHEALESITEFNEKHPELKIDEHLRKRNSSIAKIDQLKDNLGKLMRWLKKVSKSETFQRFS